LNPKNIDTIHTGHDALRAAIATRYTVCSISRASLPNVDRSAFMCNALHSMARRGQIGINAHDKAICLIQNVVPEEVTLEDFLRELHGVAGDSEEMTNLKINFWQTLFKEAGEVPPAASDFHVTKEHCNE